MSYDKKHDNRRYGKKPPRRTYNNNNNNTNNYKPNTSSTWRPNDRDDKSRDKVQKKSLPKRILMRIHDDMQQYDLTSGTFEFEGIDNLKVEYELGRVIFDVGRTQQSATVRGLICKNLKINGDLFPYGFINLGLPNKSRTIKDGIIGRKDKTRHELITNAMDKRTIAGNIMLRQLLIHGDEFVIYDRHGQLCDDEAHLPFYIDLSGGPMYLAFSFDDHGTKYPTLSSVIDINHVQVFGVRTLNISNDYERLQNQLLNMNFDGFCTRYALRQRKFFDDSNERELWIPANNRQPQDGEHPSFFAVKQALTKHVTTIPTISYNKPIISDTSHDLLGSGKEWAFDNIANVSFTVGKIEQADVDSEWHAETMRFFSVGRRDSIPASFVILFNAKNRDGKQYDVVLLNLRLGLHVDEFVHLKVNDYDLKVESWKSRRHEQYEGKASHLIRSIFALEPRCEIRLITRYGYNATSSFVSESNGLKDVLVSSCEIKEVKRANRDKDNPSQEYELNSTEMNPLPIASVGMIKIKELPHTLYKHALCVELFSRGFLPSFEEDGNTVKEHSGGISRILPPPSDDREAFFGRKRTPIEDEIKAIYKKYKS